MSLDPVLALISIIFGILVIAFEGLLRWIVGIFFILLGIWLLIDYMNKGEKKGTKAPPGPEQPKQQEQMAPPPVEKK